MYSALSLFLMTAACNSRGLDSSPNCLPAQQHAPTITDSSLPTINFDCSICFELPHDAVVTMCGHLFCWSCLHRWIMIQPIFPECPVCKACVKDKIIPLYGRGKRDDDHAFNVTARQSYVCATADTTADPTRFDQQHRSFISQETQYGDTGGWSTHSASSSGIFPALFRMQYMITASDTRGWFSSETATSTLPVRRATTPLRQPLRLQPQGSALYWFLFLLGCLASVWFLLF